MKEELARAYGQLEQWHWWFRGRTRILEALLRRELPDGQTRKILSIGCGPASGLTWLRPFAGAHGTVTGLDAEPLHAWPLPPGITFAVGSLPLAPVMDEAFDVVLALDVLEHLDDDLAGVRSIARMVAPSGVLIVTVPALPSLWGGQDVISEHRRRYTRRSLGRLFGAAALQDARITYFNTLLFPAVALTRWSRRALGLANRARSDFDDSRPGPVNEALAGIFGLERHLIDHVRFPVGVSLLVTWRRTAQSSTS